MDSRKGWMMQRKNGWKSCHTSFGHIGLHLVDPQGRPPFQLLMTVIPLKTGFPTLRTSSFTPSNNNGLLEKSLNLIEEQRENGIVQLVYYQHKLKQGYDSNVKLRPLVPGDLVLRKVFGTVKNPAWGKLGPN